MSTPRPVDLTRRELLAGAGATAAALVLESSGVSARQPAARAVVFANTTVINLDSVQDDVALAVQGDRIAAIGPTDAILKQYPNADVYNGRGKALVAGPGQLSRASRRHARARLQRRLRLSQFREAGRAAEQPAAGRRSDVDGRPSARSKRFAPARRRWSSSPATSAVTPARWSKTGLRWVFAEGVRDSENVPGPLSPEGLAKSVTPRFSPKLRDEGMQRINELFSKWHGANQRAHQRVPGRLAGRDLVAGTAAGGARVRREARPRLHDSPVAEPRRSRFHEEASRHDAAGVPRQARLSRTAAVRGALPLRGRRRYRVARQVAARSCRTRRPWPPTAA